MKNFLIAGLLTAVAGVAQAGTQTVTCDVQKNNHGYFAKEYVFDITDGSNKVAVADPVTLHFNDGTPEEAKVRRMARKTDFNWSMDIVNSGGQHAVMVYSLRFKNDSGKGTVTAKPIGYMNSLSSRVVCTTK